MYILKNLKSFAVKNTLVFVLFVVCLICDVLVILFSHGSFQNFKASISIEDSKKNAFMYSFCFGEIIDTFTDEITGKTYSVSTESITVSQLNGILSSLSKETKSSMPGMYFQITIENGNTPYAEFLEAQEDGELIIPSYQARLEYDENAGEYGLYNNYVKNVSLKAGRYFTQEEFTNGDKVAVLPNNAKLSVLGQTVNILGEQYKVIGILGENSMEEIQIPYKNIPENATVREIMLLDDNALEAKSFSEFKNAFTENLPFAVNFPQIQALDLSTVKFYNSIMFLSVALSVASAVNLAMLFGYVVKSRSRQSGIFNLCGLTKNKIRRMYLVEILSVSTLIYVIFAFIYHKAVLPRLTRYFEFIEVAYNPKVYLTVFIIYIAAIYVFVNIAVILTNNASPVKMLKEKVK